MLFKLTYISRTTLDEDKSFKDLNVPEQLYNGNHKDIENWKKMDRIKRTFFRRPELLKGILTKEERDYLKNICKDILDE